MTRTRFAPSPTGFMHIGNLRTALYEYLIAKSQNGKFILRIEDTDQNRLVLEAEKIIFDTLKITGLKYDEGPDIGGNFGPYVQSERKEIYKKYVLELIKNNHAYYCFCDKEEFNAEDRFSEKNKCNCKNLSAGEVQKNLEAGKNFVIRQNIPGGETSFFDQVYGEITVKNSELDDQVLIKSDGLPTYNFANVIDDHLMKITHVVRGCEYLSSTPKYNLLYKAFGWQIPEYIHLPLILDEHGEKLSKRKGAASFEDLMKMGFLPEAIINYIALLGWSPDNNQEIFSLAELEKKFDIKGLSKSPAIFDLAKLKWMNGEYIKKMDKDKFYNLALDYFKKNIKKGDLDYKFMAEAARTRVEFIEDAWKLFDFVDEIKDYDLDLFLNKKMKVTHEISYDVLSCVLDKLKDVELKNWHGDNLKNILMELAKEKSLKTGQIFWPLLIALSGKKNTPCGATEIAEMIGKEESLKRINFGIEKLK